MLSDIKIDKEFSSLIPPLSKEERHLLEQSIIDHGGARDPLVVWSGEPATLIDGHNRFEICDRLGLPYNVHEMQFDSREDVCDWIDANQLGRRNLTPDSFRLLLGRRYNRMKKKHGAEKGGRGNQHAALVKGQNGPLPTTATKLAKEHAVSENTVKRAGKFAEEVEQTPELQQAIIDRVPIKRAHVANNSGDNEWYTPVKYIEAARSVMGAIDLDPASTQIANDVIGAANYYTAEDDGLTKDWVGNVWMNPPYDGSLIGSFTEKLCESHQMGSVDQAIALVNNATETKWFQALASQASAICFPSGRVKFWHPQKEAVPLQGQAILYLGCAGHEFARVFSSFGFCMEAYR
jgi:phage N-6-adenine-methyltransferase